MTRLIQNILIFIAKYGIGWWYIFILPVWFRAYARSVVYNYVLQHNRSEWLGRLWQRQPHWIDALNYWQLPTTPAGHQMPSYKGRVHWRKVNKLQFYLVVFLIWGWLDDDANEDTTSRDYIQTLLTGSRKDGLFSRLFQPFLKRAKLKGVVYGNAFDLGDVRAQHPYFNFWTTLFWNCRNTAMNFQYLWTDY